MNQTEVNRRNSARRLAAVISANFDRVRILTLPCGPAVCICRKYADAQYIALIRRARCLMGGPFPYVRFVEYTDKAGISFHLIADIPPDICRELAAMWFIGKAFAKEQTPEELKALAKRLPYKPWNALPPNRQAWSASRGLMRIPPS